MAKQTLLELVQDVLAAIDGDEVNAISDTVEATQVATLIRRCYFDIITEMELPVKGTLTTLTGLGDTDTPTHMLIPESLSRIDWIKYNVKLDSGDDDQYRDIVYKTPEEFVRLVSGRPSTDTTYYQLVEINPNVSVVIAKTEAPHYWTSFDDEYIVFDGYDSNVDSTLQSSKSIIYGFGEETFTLTDDFVPELPANLFPYLYATAEAKAFAFYKQQPNPKSEQQENRGRIRAQRNKWRQGRRNNKGPDYGKRR